MPRAKTGFSEILYTKVSLKALLLVNSLAKAQGVSRALYIDAMIKKVSKTPDFVCVKKPVYFPHAPVKRNKKTDKTRW